MRHRKGFFKGKKEAYLIVAYSSIRKKSEPVSNKIIAKELGISLRTLYYYKAGKIPSKPTKQTKHLKDFFDKYSTSAGHLNRKGILLIQVAEKIRKDEGKRGGIKELTGKQIQRLIIKESDINIEVDNLLEAFYTVTESEGEGNE